MTDADAILAAIPDFQASLLPLGGQGEELAGYKGYGLATIVEILSAGLSGGPFMKDLLGLDEDGSKRPHMLGHFFLAIDVAHFVPLELFKGIVGSMARALQDSRKAPGQSRIYIAGEKEHDKEAAIREVGVTVNSNLRRSLQFLRDALNVKGYEDYL